MVTLPRKMSASSGPVRRTWPGCEAFDVDHRNDAADRRRELPEAGRGEFLGSASGLSDEPKSTVPALIWAMPPPEPIDW